MRQFFTFEKKKSWTFVCVFAKNQKSALTRVYQKIGVGFFSNFFSDERTDREEAFAGVFMSTIVRTFSGGGTKEFCFLITPSEISDFFGKTFHPREKFRKSENIVSKPFFLKSARKTTSILRKLAPKKNSFFR